MVEKSLKNGPDPNHLKNPEEKFVDEARPEGFTIR